MTYSYTLDGRLHERTWARGETTTYGYDTATGDLQTISYSDNTPDLTYEYDRLGRLKPNRTIRCSSLSRPPSLP